MSAEILSALKRIEAKLDAALAKRQSEERRKPAQAAENVASDRDLDSQYGDPTVRAEPRDWQGRSFKGCRYSECEADYLDMLANMLEYFADKKASSDPQKAGYDRRDAGRARGWAARLRAGWKPEEPPAGGDYDFDDRGGGEDIPF